MKYRKNPIVIEAFRFGINDWPQWFLEKYNIPKSDSIAIETLEGEMICNYGDWIIKGIKGEIYPCKHDIFIATYEAVE